MPIRVRNFLELGPLSLRVFGKRFKKDEWTKDYVVKPSEEMVTLMPSSDIIFVGDNQGHEAVSEVTFRKRIGIFKLRRQITKE